MRCAVVTAGIAAARNHCSIQQITSGSLKDQLKEEAQALEAQLIRSAGR